MSGRREKLQPELRAHGQDASVAKELAEIESALAKLDQGEQTLIRMVRRGQITEDKAEAALADHRRDSDLLLTRQHELQQRQLQAERISQEVWSASRLLHELGHVAESATDAQKRQLVEALVEGITVETVRLEGRPTVVATVKCRSSANLGMSTTFNPYGSRREGFDAMRAT